MKNVYLKRKIKSHINNIHRPYSICNWNDRGQWEMLKAFAHTRFITFKLKVNASICCSRVLRLFGFVLYILFIWICFVFFFIIIIMLCFAANALIEVVMVCVYIFWMSFWYCGVVRAAAGLWKCRRWIVLLLFLELIECKYENFYTYRLRHTYAAYYKRFTSVKRKTCLKFNKEHTICCCCCYCNSSLCFAFF